jgi:hypothetical protein
MTVKQQRTKPDLVNQLADFNKRLAALETANRLGTSSVDAGELAIRGGDVTVRSDNGNKVTQLLHGTNPSIRMYPGDNPTPLYRANIFSWLPADGSALQLSVERNNDGAQFGGKVLLLPNGAYYTVQRPGKPEVYISLAQFGIYDEHFRFQGRWISDDQITSADGIVMGKSAIGAGFGAAGFAFIYPFDRVPIVLYSLADTTGAVMPANGLSTLDQTGFTVAWATGTTAKTISWVAFRI